MRSFTWVVLTVLAFQVEVVRSQDVPKAHDPRLEIVLFAKEPDIVHPIAMTFDAKGRLLVIESHTHFRPNGYKGPPRDRIRVLEDTDGDGKADRYTTFHEGTKATMDIAAHPDGSIYIATRNEILRLRDTKGTGQADDVKRIVFLDTKGDYPHNGLSGLSFDFRGNVTFGMGENLGAAYKLIGADGVTIANEGDGGGVFTCSPDGNTLRRIATGFWNPFGTTYDIYGRLFAVENDPDAMPPCRLLHVIEGGDYGYQFRYGRTGRHPFQSWHGDLEGTLGMVSGTGEAPCAVMSYESDGLPTEYLGNLLVTSWADHRVERYVLKPHGSTFKADRQPFIEGGKDFRPVGLALAPDGSLFFSDWVLRDYNLHGKGAVWHLRSKEKPKARDPKAGLLSKHRPTREAAARQLALSKNQEHLDILFATIENSTDPRFRVAPYQALLAAGKLRSSIDDSEPGIRAMGIRETKYARPGFMDTEKSAEVTREAIATGRNIWPAKSFLDRFSDPDPFIRTAAIQFLSSNGKILDKLFSDPAILSDITSKQTRIGILLVHMRSGRKESRPLAAKFLADPDPEVRFFAAKWIADDKLTEHADVLRKALDEPNLSPRLFFAYATALARVEDRPVHEDRMADYFVGRVADAKASSSTRLAALLQVPNTHKQLGVGLLRQLVETKDVGLQLEAARALQGHPDPKRVGEAWKIASDSALSPEVRAEAIVAVADRAEEGVSTLLDLLAGSDRVLADEAARALIKIPLKAEQQSRVETSKISTVAKARIFGKALPTSRPKDDDTAGWLKLLEGPADADAGRRVFFHPKLANCSRCHQIDGRGAKVGPNLSGVGRTERRHLLESILQPSVNVAPHYQVWSLEMHSGKILTGMLTHTHLDDYTYLDANGGTFKVNTRDIAETRPNPSSIMPDRLVDALTDQELRDLLAYLESRK